MNDPRIALRPTMVGILRCGKMLPPQLNLVIEIEFADATAALWSSWRASGPWAAPTDPSSRPDRRRQRTKKTARKKLRTSSATPPAPLMAGCRARQVPLPETLPRYPKPCPATKPCRYPKPCPATRDLLSSLPETLPRYPKPCRYPRPCPATGSLARTLAPLPQNPCPTTGSLARTLAPLPEALPEPLPRYRKPCQNPCPATRSLARTLAPLPEALPETLPRYPKHCCCCCWCWCCCWCSSRVSQRIDKCSHGTLLHFNLQSPHLKICHTNPRHTERSPSKQNHAKINVTSVQKPTQNACKKNMSCQNREGVTGRGRENGPLFPHP